jgi:hypothetical protein
MAGAVKIYNHSEHVVHPSTDDTPWPIVWVLGRYSSRHIFVNKREPDSDLFHSEINNFINKQKWKHHLHDQVDDVVLPFRVPRGPTPPCTVPRHPLLQSWFVGFQKCMSEGFQHAKRVSKSRSFSNLLPITKLGFRLLKQLGLVAVKNDKDYGFSLQLREVQAYIHLEVLDSIHYQEVAVSEARKDMLFPQYISLCDQLGSNSKNFLLGRECKRSLSRAGGSPIASLLTLCKTHKKKNKEKWSIGMSMLHPAIALPDWVNGWNSFSKQS